ncbi:MAG: Rne/Rng family ribonuclease, partial [Thermoanaerobaculia bacterium]|nr:Rne/Rng family ribonuclease [Thermoanaerobaculia bacterium]
MTRRMLINAQSNEELRIAVVDGPTLEELQVEVAERGLTRGNIYRGRIANIQPSLNAAFIDYGAERHGFLALQDLVPEAYYHQPKGKDRPRIEDVLDKGKPIVVQVTKEPEGQKGAALTTNLSLAGRYLVVTPFDASIGVSRKVDDDETRKALKQLVKKLEVPDGCGAIVRTNAHGQNKTTLNRDLNALLRLWKRISSEARKGKEIKLLYSDQDIILQSLRDYLDTSIEEVVVDAPAAYTKAEQYMSAFMPRSKTQLVRYEERTPIFSKYHLETQIDRIYQRSVELPSGGSIVIDRAEALTAIDINSGRSTKARSQEETALHTNLESALEVARQLRLRDIGGLIVVDFIDMRATKNRRRVEKTLRDAMKPDKARFDVGRISSNGLLEINRQRIKQALLMRTHHACPTCGGTGRLASPELVGLNLIRRIEARAASGMIKAVEITLHAEVADAVQNQRRRELAAIENEFGIHIEIVSSSRFHPSEQKIEWTARPVEERTIVPSEPIRKEVATALTLTQSSSDMEAYDDEDEDESEEESSARRSRRRRRGGRRRRRGGGEATQSGENGQNQSVSAGSSSNGRDSEPQSEGDGESDNARQASDGSSEDDDKRPSSRRRRGRRGGRGRRREQSEGQNEADASTPTQEAAGDGKDSEAAAETPRRARSGRSGRSRRERTGNSDIQMSAEVESKGDAEPSNARQDPKERTASPIGVTDGAKASETKAGASSTAKEESGPDKPSRPRRGRSSRKAASSSTDSATDKGSSPETTPAKAAASESVPGSKSGSPRLDGTEAGPSKPKTRGATSAKSEPLNPETNTLDAGKSDSGKSTAAKPEPKKPAKAEAKGKAIAPSEGKADSANADETPPAKA